MIKSKAHFVTIAALLLLFSSCFSSSFYPPKSLIGKTLQLMATKTKDTDSTSSKELAYKFLKTNKYMVYFDGKLVQTGYFTYGRKKSNKVKIICTYQIENTPATYEIILVFHDERSGTWECPHHKKLAGAHAGDFILE